MIEEPPIDLRALDTADVQLVHEAARRFRRRILVRTLWILVFALAIGSVSLRVNYELRMHRNINYIASQVAGAWNTDTVGDYRLPGVQVGLIKVVALPQNRWGLQLVVRWDSPGRAEGIFTLTSGPHSLTSSGWPVAGQWAQTFVDVPMSMGRRFGMRLMAFDNETAPPRVIGTFTVDLDALGVPPAGGR
jgi:hypothetical protein